MNERTSTGGSAKSQVNKSDLNKGGKQRQLGQRRGFRKPVVKRPKFEGDDLKGHIYDCSDARQADMFIKTTKEIAGQQLLSSTPRLRRFPVETSGMQAPFSGNIHHQGRRRVTYTTDGYPSDNSTEPVEPVPYSERYPEAFGRAPRIIRGMSSGQSASDSSDMLQYCGQVSDGASFGGVVSDLSFGGTIQSTGERLNCDRDNIDSSFEPLNSSSSSGSGDDSSWSSSCEKKPAAKRRQTQKKQSRKESMQKKKKTSASTATTKKIKGKEIAHYCFMQVHDLISNFCYLFE